MREQYKILDTNIHIIDPQAMLCFMPKREDTVNYVVIPIIVLKELEHFKSEMSGRGRNARETFRVLKDALAKYGGNLHEGIKVEENYILKSSYDIEKSLDGKVSKLLGENNDAKIMGIYQTLKEQGKDVEIITNDSPMTAIASSIGATVNEWKDYRLKEVYYGWREHEIDRDSYMRLRDEKHLLPDDIGITDANPNEYFLLKGSAVPKEIVKCKFDSKTGKSLLKPVYSLQSFRSAVKPRNPRQAMLMDACRDPEIKLVFAVGAAGSGKTFLAVDAGIEQCIVDHRKNPDLEQVFSGMLLTKPLIEEDDEIPIGALPGELFDKTKPYLQSIYDQFDQLFEKKRYSMDEQQSFFDSRMIEVSALVFMRGRTIYDKYWIFDEAQNVSRKKIMKIGTRIGDSAKLIVTGDPLQSDVRGENGLYNSSLIYASNSFKTSPNAATIIFTEEDCVRSEIANEFLHRMAAEGQNYSRTIYPGPGSEQGEGHS